MRPLILISNDDGYQARGVQILADLLSRIGDVVAICPEGPQSGKSMAITVNSPLRVREITERNTDAITWYAVNGTPADCIKIAMHTILRNRRPDIVCTGINHGSNAAINVLYSGTMGAAFEGCAFGIPAVGFSLDDHSPDADFTQMLPYIEKISRGVLANGLPYGICLNVNAPANTDIKGMRITVACRGNWTDEYRELTDGNGSPYYMLTGDFVNEEPENPDTDDALMKQGYLSIVPCGIDRTVPSAFTPEWLESLND